MVPAMSNTIAQLRLVSSAKSAGTSTRDSRRAYINPECLRTHKLTAGDWALLDATDAVRRVVQLWPKLGLEEDEVELCQQAEDGATTEVGLIPLDVRSQPPPLLKTVTLVEQGQSSKTRGEEEDPQWTRACLKEALAAHRYLSAGQRVVVEDCDSLRYFLLRACEPSTKLKPTPPPEDPSSLLRRMQSLSIAVTPPADLGIFQFDWRTQVNVEGQDTRRDTGYTRRSDSLEPAMTSVKPTSAPSTLVNSYTPSAEASAVAFSNLGGLDTQIKQIRTLLELPLQHPSTYTSFGLKPPRGILLYGPPGTGKTAMARAVASSFPQCSCIVVNGPELSSAFHGETEERLRGIFVEAKRKSPCIVVLDEIDALCPRRDGDGGEVERRVVATLLTLMDGMDGTETEKVFVIAATNRPNSIDPALRRPGRFDREIEIGIPDAVGRQRILEILLARMPHSLSQEAISSVAAKTHGFVGADLTALVRESATSAIQRWYDTPTKADASSPILSAEDLALVLPTMRPSTMREVFVETPSVRWTDIGGQEEVKQKLRECVEWPLTHRDTFLRLGVEAPRGVLLYGPPGCSKTMTAKALATESGLNFLAVKGPELLNKYVGESEKAVREVFRKARTASPSIIFFDEIDALGSARSDGESPHNGVLTSLLNEMDGVEELSGVTIVAATNRPDVLDSALMRPGRLDRILYVGAPDLAARKDIFRIRLSKMAVEPGVDVVELAQLTEGCSGAEVASICQDAALTAMNEDLEAPFVKRSHLIHSAKTVRRRITPEMLHFFEDWRDQSGVRSA